MNKNVNQFLLKSNAIYSVFRASFNCQFIYNTTTSQKPQVMCKARPFLQEKMVKFSMLMGESKILLFHYSGTREYYYCKV